jgi:hypothetical protein
VATKLAMADELAAQGRLHGDIAKSLGVSVMTYHRWRKARSLAHPAPKQVIDAGRSEMLADREQMTQIRELRAENLRLRRLVADLLLEKDKLEEGLRTGVNDRYAAHN